MAGEAASHFCDMGTRIGCETEGPDHVLNVRSAHWRRSIRALCVARRFVAGASPGYAGPNDISDGLDEKVSSARMGWSMAPGKDELLVMDVTKPAKPCCVRDCR